MTRRRLERITSVPWLVVGIAIAIGGFRLSLGTLNRPGPGFFAFLAGSALTILSCVNYWNNRGEASHGSVERVVIWRNRPRARRMAYALLAALLYAIGMNFLGFALSTFLFLGFILRFIDPQRWPTVLICSVLGSSGSWLIFKYWLDVQLPGGLIGY